jgi:uncharacterized protein YutE (UPF0331/DUF86 family)
MVDETLILRKLSELEQYFGQITEYKETTVDEYINDWKLQRIIERTLQMMIETCVDIAGHIISDNNYRIPDSYADAFIVLSENKVIPAGLCQTMVKISKFRNIIVHHYDRVDAEIVVGILKRQLDDFNSYKKSIIDYLNPQKTK